jgi:low affinity Fe/Cu permease
MSRVRDHAEYPARHQEKPDPEVGPAMFQRLARATSNIVGSGLAFSIAMGCLIVWALTGPIFNFSDTWQLIINTGTTCITFLMVFLIQNTQNRETKAMNLKLDELTLAVKEAKNKVVAVENKDDQVLEEIEEEHNTRVKSTTDLT